MIFFPPVIVQGDPVIVTIHEAKIADIAQINFASGSLPVFLYDNKPTAFGAVDLNQAPGNYDFTVQLKNGKILKQTVAVGKRKVIEQPLGIPEKLGGNTEKAQKNLVVALAKENNILKNLWTNPKKLWAAKFRPPVADPVITDEYGYLRQTGAYLIPHKGADFRAPEGTKVFAMNRGVVRLARSSKIYGKTVVIDHGMGLMTFYMHLSKIYVKKNYLVRPGQLIGLSGETGYATRPHLHLTVRINNTSIDPIKFLEFFNSVIPAKAGI